MFRKRRPTDSGSSGNTRSPGGSKKQRVVDCAKILLDIAKESADWFPPLKAALGGVSSLVKHYEEFEDVRERIEELIPQLDRFKQNITTTAVDEDPDETNRRKGLTSTFKQVEQFSQKLLVKSALARFTDKGEDSKMVARLVERFREAIVCYQISQQQAIYNQITHLASSFNTFLRLQEKPPVVRDKLKSILARLSRLKRSSWKELQHERWVKLFDDLRPIRDRAKGLYERIVAEGYVEDEADVSAVSGLAEDIRDVLLEYWMVQQQEIYDQNCTLIDAADLSVLNSCRRAKGAEYRHSNRRGCLKGTRDTVLNEIESWARDFNKSPVFWLNGLAGTGKSTIAQTIAERFFAEERLGASFFCSRDFEDRSDLHFIFPTLAFQLAYRYPDFRSHFVSLLKTNPDVAHESLYNQMQKLIVGPLRTIGTSTVIVIDALDECKDDEPSSAILSVLARFVEQIPRVKFFITGRPEPRIKTGFRLPLLVDSTNVFVLHEVHRTLINHDIQLFLKHELSELARRRQLGAWPDEGHIDLLCRRAGGLFIYAVATVKFLDSNAHLPRHRLNVILELPESTAPEGRTRFNPKTSLDSLYTSILQTAFSEGDFDVDFKARAIIGTIVLVVNPLSPSAIAQLIGLEPEEVTLFLALIQSLLTEGENSDQPVKPFHKSFPDFITDPSRCAEPRFCVSPGRLHLELTMNCLRVMNDGLEQDLLSLPEYALNSEVEDLQTRIDGRISTALKYACRSWHNHLTAATGDITNVIPGLRIFLEVKFLAWLEVLSVLGDVGGAAFALGQLMAWLKEVSKDTQLLETATDYFYFVTKFFEPINASATHIYHSALELCPTSSVVRRLYYHRHHRIARSPRIVIGASDSWDQTVSISGKGYGYGFCAWSPCSQFVAAQTETAVEIRNQQTLELLTVLQVPEITSHLPLPRATRLLTGPLAYSPDGRSLACASNFAIVTWDIQTGGVAKEIKHSANITSLVWSSDGETIAVLDNSTAITQPCVRTYDVFSGANVSTTSLQSVDTPRLWAYQWSFRVMTTRREASAYSHATVEIFDIGPALTKVDSFSVGGSRGYKNMSINWVYSSAISSFFPATWRVSISAPYLLRISERQNSNYLLQETGSFSSPCFSPRGSFFAASKENGVIIWKDTRGRYTLWREFRCQSRSNSLQFSPNTSSIVGHSGNILQVWRLDDLSATPRTRRQQYAGISRSGNHIATANKLETTVTFINIHSRTPSQFIDTCVGIEGLVLTGNVLLVVGSGRVVAWPLTEDGLVDGVFGNGRASQSDSIWTVSLPQWRSELWNFLVEGRVGVIRPDGNALFIYDTDTGEILDLTHAPPAFNNPWCHLSDVLCGQNHLQHHDLPHSSTSTEGGWQTSRTTLREGWVKDSEGRHRLWVPVEWRASWDLADWRHDIATQFSILGGKPVIIKF